MSYDFTGGEYEDPGPNVLDNGLPALPDAIAHSTGVAVARWVDGDFGAVLSVYRNDSAAENFSEGSEYEFTVQGYRQVAGVWEVTPTSGGSTWQDPPFERDWSLSRFGVVSGHSHQGGDDGSTIRIVSGTAGEGVVSIEILHLGRTHRMPIESPIGAWIVGLVGEGPAHWIARDDKGLVAASGELDQRGSAFPPWMNLPFNDSLGISEIQYEGDQGYGFETTLNVFNEDQLSPEAAEWFRRQMKGGRLPDEEYIEAESIPEWQRIAQDLMTTTGIALRIVAYPSTDFPQTPLFEISINGVMQGAFSQGFDDEEQESELAWFADLLCEQFLHEEVWGGWPICPKHRSHPLDPGIDSDGIASWMCPDGTVSIRIGNLTKELLEPGS